MSLLALRRFREQSADPAFNPNSNSCLPSSRQRPGFNLKKKKPGN